MSVADLRLGSDQAASGSCAEVLRELEEALETQAASNVPDCSRLKSARLEALKHQMLHQLLRNLDTKDAACNAVLQQFQAMHVTQRLQIEGGPSPDDAGLAGSSHHCLGVCPIDLRRPSASEHEQLSVLRRVSGHLAESSAKWAAMLDASPVEKSSAALPGGVEHTLSQRLPQQVAARRDACRRREAAVPQQLRQILATATRVLTMYMEMDREMLHFLETEVLTHQAGLDAKNLAYDEAWVALLGAKLSAIEAQMEWQTYTPSHLQALSRVSVLIQEQLASLQQQAESTSTRLSTYRGLGPGFVAVCKEYGHTRRQVAEVQHMLANFDAVVAELEQ